MSTVLGADPLRPGWMELDRARRIFEEHEGRDAMYRVALHLLDEHQWWGDHERMVDALKVLLLTWNSSFYRYGPLDESAAQAFLRSHLPRLAEYRNRSIREFSSDDAKGVQDVFDAMLPGLRIAAGAHEGYESPVSVGKALHVLAPTFFPLWDNSIAMRYGCMYSREPARAYLQFMIKTRAQVDRLDAEGRRVQDVLKRIDEYNYVRFSKPWWDEDSAAG